MSCAPPAPADALSRLRARGARVTEPRVRVLQLLIDAGRPMKAYDLIAAAGPDGAAASPPTVYRALEFLCGTGLAHRIESTACYVSCAHEAGAGDHAHEPLLLVCDGCGAVNEVPLGPAAHAAGAAARGQGFAMSGLVMEARGLCATCGAGG